MGDFNLPKVNWPEGHILPGMSKHEQRQAESLLDLTNMLFMEQIILHPTRDNNILDLCFTNNMELIHNVRVTPTIHSDHNIVELTMYGPKESTGMYPTRSTQSLSTLNFHKANWKLVQKEILKQNWPERLSTHDNDSKLKRFMSTMQAICMKFVPEKKNQPTQE